MDITKLLFSFCFCLLATTIIVAQPGSLDPTFGNGGKVISSNVTSVGQNAAALQIDGKIIVAGVLDGKFAVFRFDTNGTPDTTFGTGGSVTTEFYSGFGGSANAIAVQSDGRIVVGGSTNKSGGSLLDGTDFAVARFLSNGALDTSFGTGTGRVVSNIANDSVKDLAVQPDGKILITGDALERVASQNYIGRNIFAIRYNADGTPDADFGLNGTATASYRISTACPVLNEPHNPEALALQSDGKIIVTGYVAFCDPSQPNFFQGGAAIVRFLSNGQLDNSFDSDGKVVNSDILSANAVALQPDGKIVVVGQSGNPYGNPSVPYDFGILRYTTTGSLDTSFDGDGKVVTSVESYNDIPRDVLIQSNGKIVVTGESSVLVTGFAITNFAIARLNSNGSLDTSFDGDGKVITDINNGDLDSISRVVLQPDGKILVVGFTQPNNGSGSIRRLVLARYIGDTSVNRAAQFDFDGDRRSDVSLLRPTNGTWYILPSGSGGFYGFPFGQAGDQIAPADYDGDGKTDVAVYRDGTWYLNRSQLGFTGIAFGASDDIPVPADYDGDGKADVAVYRPSSGTWYLQRSQLGFTGIQFGISGDLPVTGDYDGDGRDDLAVFRPSNGVWYLQRSTLGFTGIQFGQAGDKLVPADYDGDSKTDLAVFRPSTATWYINRSQLGSTVIQFGVSTDIPVPADYDGDGKADIAVYRNDTWFIQRSTAGFTGVQFGGTGDQPVPNAFVR